MTSKIITQEAFCVVFGLNSRDVATIKTSVTEEPLTKASVAGGWHPQRKKTFKLMSKNSTAGTCSSTIHQLVHLEKKHDALASSSETLLGTRCFKHCTSGWKKKNQNPKAKFYPKYLQRKYKIQCFFSPQSLLKQLLQPVCTPDRRWHLFNAKLLCTNAWVAPTHAHTHTQPTHKPNSTSLPDVLPSNCASTRG